jgi:hypothetical protein
MSGHDPSVVPETFAVPADAKRDGKITYRLCEVNDVPQSAIVAVAINLDIEAVTSSAIDME